MPTSASPATGARAPSSVPGGAQGRAAPQQGQLAHAAGERVAAQARERGRAGEQGRRERAEGGGGVEVGLEVHGAPALPRVLDEEGQRAQPAQDDEQARHRAQRGARRRPRPAGGGRAHQDGGRGDDGEADEHEHGLGPGAGGPQAAGGEAAGHHAGREGAVGEAQHGPAGGGLAAHALGVDGDVHRAGGRAQDEQRRAQAGRRGRQPGQRGRPAEGGERRRQRRRAPAVDERPGRRAWRRRAPAPMHSSAMPSWPSSTPACVCTAGSVAPHAPQKTPKAAKPPSTRTRPATRPAYPRGLEATRVDLRHGVV